MGTVHVFSAGTVVYCLLVLSLFGVVCGLAVRQRKHLWATIGLLGLAYLLTIGFANNYAGDYVDFLLPWVEFYQGLGFVKSMQEITTLSDYTPFYNYFLIVIAQLCRGENILYAIKLITLFFSFVLSAAMELIVSYLRQSRFSYLRMAIFMLMPLTCLEYAIWTQCDAIYTCFCLLALYFALRHKSKLSFVMIGLAFMIKMQFLFIVPILFLMLLIKDIDGKHYLQWKDIWLAPLMYAVNLLPVLFGASLWKILMVYLQQTNVYQLLSMNSPNLASFFDFFQYNTWPYYTVMVALIVLTLGVMLALLIYLYMLNRQQPLSHMVLVYWGFVFAFVMFFLMPKMHERFIFIAVCLAWISAMAQGKRRYWWIAGIITFTSTAAYVKYMFCLPVDWLKIVCAIINLVLLGYLLVQEILDQRRLGQAS